MSQRRLVKMIINPTLPLKRYQWTRFPQIIGNEIPWLFHPFSKTKIAFSVTISAVGILSFFGNHYIQKGKNITLIHAQNTVRDYVGMQIGGKFIFPRHSIISRISMIFHDSGNPVWTRFEKSFPLNWKVCCPVLSHPIPSHSILSYPILS